MSASLAALTKAPAELTPAQLAEVLAVVIVDVVEALRISDRQVVLEGLANTLDRQGRTPGGSEAAAMLGSIGAALMQAGC